MRIGMETYFKHINAQGGVNGRKLKLVVRDDGYEPEKAKDAVKALIEEDKVFALAGSVGTPTGLAAVPLLTDAKVPLVGMFTGAQALRDPFNRYIFHVRASYFDETERIVQHLTTLGMKKIAVFYQNDSYGKAGLQGVERALARRQLKPVATATVERNAVDVSQSLKPSWRRTPKPWYRSARTSPARLSSRRAVRRVLADSSSTSASWVPKRGRRVGRCGRGVVISQVVPFPYAPTTAVVREYQQRMTAAGHSEFDFSSLEGYLTAQVLVEGLKRAGRNLTRESLIAGLESMRELNLGGFTINYAPDRHMGSTFTELTIIGRGGKFVH